MKKLFSLLALLFALRVSAQVSPPHGGGAVEGRAAQGFNGNPVNPLIAGGLQPAINANFTKSGLDNVGTGSAVANGGGGTYIPILTPAPTNGGEAAIAIEASVPDNAGGGPFPNAGWVCQLGNCNGGSQGNFVLYMAQNASQGTPFSRRITNSPTGGNLIDTILLFNPAVGATIATRNPFAISNSLTNNLGGGTVQAGSVIVAGINCVGFASPCTISALTDSLGNTYKQVNGLSISNGINPGGMVVFATTGPSNAGADTLTLTPGPGVAAGNYYFWAFEVTGTASVALNRPTASLNTDANGNLIVSPQGSVNGQPISTNPLPVAGSDGAGNARTIATDALGDVLTAATFPAVLTGDAGTKTSNFNGATQTNTVGRGAVITIILGTVAGTTPTLAAQLQWSPDDGTTWLNYGPVLPNLTATNQTGTIIVYPTNLSTAGATPAAFALGSTVTVQSNAPLPRTWRLAYTLAGTAPSFAISSVQVNYIQ